MAKQLFRKVSLERLSSPEQLDQLIQVTSPKGWLSLAALGILVVSGVIWSIVGKLPEKITGPGILLRTGGIYEVVAPAGGRLLEIYVKDGDDVQVGQLVARIEQPELLETLTAARETFAALRRQSRETDELIKLQDSQKLELVEQQRKVLEDKQRATQTRIEWSRERVKEMEGLLKDGLVTRQDVLEAQKQLDDARQELLNAQSSLDQVQLDLTQFRAQQLRDSDSLKNELETAEATMLLAEINYDDASRVRSAYKGRVFELDAAPGDELSPGAPFLKLDRTGDDVLPLQAVLFVSAGPGKKVQLAMDAQLAPASVEQEKFGFVRGVVTRVAEYPESTESMMELLHDDALVQSLMEGGAPIRVEADLIPDPRVPSGYKWSTSDGPLTRLQPGTLAVCSVVLSERAPITLVIPYLKKHLLGVGESAESH